MSDTSKFDWQAERAEVAALVKQNILDPIAIVVGLLGRIAPAKQYVPESAEIARLLSLLVMGAHSELELYCSFGSPLFPPLSDVIEEELKRHRPGA